MEIGPKFCPVDCFTVEEWPKGARVAVCEHPTMHPEETRRVIDYNSTGTSEFARIIRPKWCQRFMNPSTADAVPLPLTREAKKEAE